MRIHGGRVGRLQIGARYRIQGGFQLLELAGGLCITLRQTFDFCARLLNEYVDFFKFLLGLFQFATRVFFSAVEWTTRLDRGLVSFLRDLPRSFLLRASYLTSSLGDGD